MSIKASLNTLKIMNEKMYPKLSADERFAMVIKSIVNDDEVHREKLVKSCPMVTYSQSDNAYTDRVEASRDIVTVFIIQLLEYDKVISIMKILQGFNYKERENKAERKMANDVQAFLNAFETFCEKYLGIKSKEIIQAWYGYDERFIHKIIMIKEYIDNYQLDYDHELMENWLEKVFLKAWISRVKV